MKKVAIVIPFHKASVSKNEKISIKHLNHYLGRYDKYLVLPEKIPNIKYPILNTKKIFYFPDEYFASVPKYCEMINLEEFYINFKDYEYVLLYQLDVLVFSDQLKYWCEQGYDYIGAPWFNPTIGRLSCKKGSVLSGANGGFSLRKVNSFLKVIRLAKNEATRYSNNPLIRKLWFVLAVLTGQSHRKWLKAEPVCYPFNEDGFWSYEAPKYLKDFKVAPFKVALKFGFEVSPKKYFKLNNSRLPFGCHAWEKYGKEFWKPYIFK